MNTTPSKYIIQASNLSKTVVTKSGLVEILKDVHLGIENSEVVAIWGSSGSGKTTLLSILAGLDATYTGQVNLLGYDLAKLTEDAKAQVRKQSVGFVFQSFLLIPELTALENVLLPLEISGELTPHRIQKAEELLGLVGLTHRSKHYPATLSGGEQQRVALARAFVIDPQVLFVDEPTGSLDSDNGKLIIDLLFQLNAVLKTTIVIVTHDHDLAKKCGRILQIKAGRLIDQNLPSEEHS
jgi:putative ABC transport system ATP-binding protein